jgi:hypothetical protein
VFRGCVLWFLLVWGIIRLVPDMCGHKYVNGAFVPAGAVCLKLAKDPVLGFLLCGITILLMFCAYSVLTGVQKRADAIKDSEIYLRCSSLVDREYANFTHGNSKFPLHSDDCNALCTVLFSDPYKVQYLRRVVPMFDERMAAIPKWVVSLGVDRKGWRHVEFFVCRLFPRHLFEKRVNLVLAFILLEASEVVPETPLLSEPQGKRSIWRRSMRVFKVSAGTDMKTRQADEDRIMEEQYEERNQDLENAMDDFAWAWNERRAARDSDDEYRANEEMRASADYYARKYGLPYDRVYDSMERGAKEKMSIIDLVDQLHGSSYYGFDANHTPEGKVVEQKRKEIVSPVNVVPVTVAGVQKFAVFNVETSVYHVCDTEKDAKVIVDSNAAYLVRAKEQVVVAQQKIVGGLPATKQCEGSKPEQKRADSVPRPEPAVEKKTRERTRRRSNARRSRSKSKDGRQVQSIVRGGPPPVRGVGCVARCIYQSTKGETCECNAVCLGTALGAIPNRLMCVFTVAQHCGSDVDVKVVHKVVYQGLVGELLVKGGSTFHYVKDGLVLFGACFPQDCAIKSIPTVAVPTKLAQAKFAYAFGTDSQGHELVSSGRVRSVNLDLDTMSHDAATAVDTKDGWSGPGSSGALVCVAGVGGVPLAVGLHEWLSLTSDENVCVIRKNLSTLLSGFCLLCGYLATSSAELSVKTSLVSSGIVIIQKKQ